MIEKIIKVLTCTSPAVIFFVNFFQTSPIIPLESADYLNQIYLAVFTTFLLFSIILSFMWPFKQRTFFRNCLRVQLTAWALSLVVLAILNSTPLCVGINNGDGFNTFAMCQMRALIGAVAYSAVVIVIGIFISFIGFWFSVGSDQVPLDKA